MKFVHLSDLHLGKRLNEYSLIEDQEYILKVILGIVDDEKPNAVIIAGDIYDKSMPSAEAVTLFDNFLVSLANRKLQVFVISGNHDSADRLAFGGRLMDLAGVHMSPVYDGNVVPIKLSDEYGDVNVYMLPFIKPIHVKQAFNDDTIEGYSNAVDYAVKHMEIDKTQRNIIVTHQFVTGAERSDSEEISVGGSDNVDATVFSDFDYVALGHIHGPQSIGKETIRYCGTPLKYSFSEVNHIKSVTIVNMSEKGNLVVDTVPLKPMRDMVEIKGTYNEIMGKDYYKDLNQDDYYRIILTDEDDIPDAMGKLRQIYHGIMRLDYDNKRTQSNQEIEVETEIETKSPLQLFEEFYELQNNQSMSETQYDYSKNLIENTWEEAK